ncbi:hypothetical protein OQA88_5281 [Cercophora sp. LCS_1]
MTRLGEQPDPPPYAGLKDKVLPQAETPTVKSSPQVDESTKEPTSKTKVKAPRTGLTVGVKKDKDLVNGFDSAYFRAWSAWIPGHLDWVDDVIKQSDPLQDNKNQLVLTMDDPELREKMDKLAETHIRHPVEITGLGVAYGSR